MIGVYKIKFSCGKFYIGCSYSIGHRLASHLNLLHKDRHGNSLLTAAYAKDDRPSFEVLQETTLYDMFFVEENIIRSYGVNPMMLNLTAPTELERLSKSLSNSLAARDKRVANATTPSRKGDARKDVRAAELLKQATDGTIH